MFIDETGTSTKMARLHGRARSGERLCAAIPPGHWNTTTFVGVLWLTVMTAPIVLDGPMAGEWFLAYTIEHLWRVICDCLDAFTPAECANDFADAGYDAY